MPGRSRQQQGDASGATLELIGWREWVALPALGIARIRAKVDTGARTSTLHAVPQRQVEVDGGPGLRFLVAPLQPDGGWVMAAARYLGQRQVRTADGAVQLRPVIATPVCLGEQVWTIQVTLTDRAAMGFRLLLGRRALRGRFAVDGSRSFVCGHPRRRDDGERPLLSGGPVPISSV